MSDVIAVGRFFFARVGPLTITLCDADPITDEMVSNAIGRMIELGARAPGTVSLTRFDGAYPNSAQRRIIADLLAKGGVPKTKAQAVVTDPAGLRGALVAFGWLLESPSRAFASSQVKEACTWLAQCDPFDVDEALAAYRRCDERLRAR